MLTGPQRSELRLLAREPQNTFGRWRKRVQNTLVRMGLAKYDSNTFESLCSITEKGKRQLAQNNDGASPGTRTIVGKTRPSKGRATKPNRYPLHETLIAHAEQVRTLNNFLDWLKEMRWEIVRRTPREAHFVSLNLQPESIIGAYMRIDPEELDAEKKMMLEDMREIGSG